MYTHGCEAEVGTGVEDADVGQAFRILLFVIRRDQYSELRSGETIDVTRCVSCRDRLFLRDGSRSVA